MTTAFGPTASRERTITSSQCLVTMQSSSITTTIGWEACSKHDIAASTYACGVGRYVLERNPVWHRKHAATTWFGISL